MVGSWAVQPHGSGTASDTGRDARSDLFSLGVVLYFMLTGQRPFQGNSIATVCFKLANHEPLAVANYDISFPPELDLVVSMCIAKDPAQRYQSGGEMARDIQRLRDCGLVPAADLRQTGLSHLPAEITRNTSIVLSPESKNRPMSDAGGGVASMALPSLALTRNRTFALALVAAAVIFVVFSRTYRSRHPHHRRHYSMSLCWPNPSTSRSNVARPTRRLI